MKHENTDLKIIECLRCFKDIAWNTGVIKDVNMKEESPDIQILEYKMCFKDIAWNIGVIKDISTKKSEHKSRYSNTRGVLRT